MAIMPPANNSNRGEVRCFCGYPDDDGNMISCERCNRWQHMLCYYPYIIGYESHMRLKHRCLDCERRFVDVEGAMARQRAKREHWHRANPAWQHQRQPSASSANGAGAAPGGEANSQSVPLHAVPFNSSIFRSWDQAPPPNGTPRDHATENGAQPAYQHQPVQQYQTHPQDPRHAEHANGHLVDAKPPQASPPHDPYHPHPDQILTPTSEQPNGMMSGDPKNRPQRQKSLRGPPSPTKPSKVSKRPKKPSGKFGQPGERRESGTFPDSNRHTAAHPPAFPCILAIYGCASASGSKNEWKRHVQTQHLRPGFWRCDQCPDVDRGRNSERSPKVFNRKDLFIQHVRRMHPLANRVTSDQEEEEELGRIAARCYRHIRSLPDQSACVYCDAEFKGSGSWDERMEHVGRHLQEERKNGAEAKMDPAGWKKDDLLEEWLIKEGLLMKKEEGLKLTY